MEIVFSPAAREDLSCWVKSGNKVVLQKISKLIEAINQTPYEGIGNPEPLKYSLTGTWSRRINLEHRIVYEIAGNRLFIHSVRGHYKS